MSFASAFDSDDESTPRAAAAALVTPPSCLPSYADNWVLFSALDAPGRAGYPCRCCSLVSALSEHDGFYTCLQTGRRWLIVESAPDLTQPHDISVCDGANCSFHPLHNRLAARWVRGEAAGMLWGDLDQQELDIEMSLETPAEKEARVRQAVEEEKITTLKVEAYRMAKEADLVAHRAKMGLKRGDAPRKQPIPCKKLYSCVGDKKTGRGAMPTTKHVSSECWAWEYTDPVKYDEAIRQGATPEEAKEYAMKHIHTCPWLHPGEEGWLSQWNTDRDYKPVGAGAGAAAQSQNGNRFANFVASERHRGFRGDGKKRAGGGGSGW